jgi:hypothetical protein
VHTIYKIATSVLQEFYVQSTRASGRLSHSRAGALIEAARLLNCHSVLPEDLSAGQSCRGIRVTNPFRQ